MRAAITLTEDQLAELRIYADIYPLHEKHVTRGWYIDACCWCRLDRLRAEAERELHRRGRCGCRQAGLECRR